MTWYRNADPSVYHKRASDWVKSSKAVCGRGIPRPKYTAPDPAAVERAGQRCCKSCLGDKVYLRKVRINQGGYTDGGVYFGQGLPLYFWSADYQEGYLRAVDRDDARAQVATKVNGARFYA